MGALAQLSSFPNSYADSVGAPLADDHLSSPAMRAAPYALELWLAASLFAHVFVLARILEVLADCFADSPLLK